MSKLEGAYYSAKQILPEVIKIAGPPGSYLDIGCGDGSWMLAAHQLGYHPIWGYDILTDNGVTVPPGAVYRAYDVLADDHPAWRRWDLVVCVEVAEHIQPHLSRRLVHYLTSAAREHILFSAAPPGQGPYPPEGATPETLHNWHNNERSPEFWNRLFDEFGWDPDYRISKALGSMKRIDPWYRSNVKMFIKRTVATVNA